jgi:ABC-2 type transport system permease protein
MNGDITRLTLRQLLRGKRLLALGLIPLVPVIVAVAWRLAPATSSFGSTSGHELYAALMETLLLPTCTAFVALVLGASAIGDEREDGTILYLAATPLPRRTIVSSKALAAWIATVTLCLPGVVLCAVLTLGGDALGRAGAWSVLGLLLVAAAYVAVFAAVSLGVGRPVVVGFLYVVLWEGSIATFAPSAQRFSISAYGRALTAHGLPGVKTYNVPNVAAGAAVLVLVVVTVLATAFGARRLGRVELP